MTFEVVLPNGDRASAPDRAGAELAARWLTREAAEHGAHSGWLNRELIIARLDGLDVAAPRSKGRGVGAVRLPGADRIGTDPKGGHSMARKSNTSTTPTAPKPKGAVKITAAKGGDLLLVKVAAVKKALKKAKLQELAREHGLNPSQLRRLSLGEVKRVDAKRAAAIAKALDLPVADLFDKAEPKPEAAKPATPKAAKPNGNDKPKNGNGKPNGNGNGAKADQPAA